MAFNTSVSGTCYVYMSGNGNTSGRYDYIIFQSTAGSADAAGQTGDNASLTTAATYNTETVMKYTATTGGTFHIVFGNGAKVYAVRYVPETIITPSISQDGNSVTITPGTSSITGTTIATYYTTDGSDPTPSSTPNTGEINIEEDCTIKAISISSGGASSEVASLKCTYSPPAKTDISGATVNLSKSSFVYNGSAQAPTVSSVVLSGNTLTSGTDYTVSEIASQTNVGTGYTVTVTGIGSYEGTASATWSITPAAGSISYATASVNKTVGDEPFINELTHTGDGTVTYSIDPTSVATINENTGEVTIVAAGSATVTATVANGTNYNYAETTATYTLTVSASEPSTPTLTVTTGLTGGSIAADPSGEVASGTSVTLTATPESGYQLKSWKSGDYAYGSLPKSLVQTITMPESNLDITAEFEAQPETAPSITTSKTWTFGEDYAVGTILSYQQVYNYDGLYITGHSTTKAAEIETGGTDVGTTVERHVKFPGQIGSINSSTKANDAVSNAIALNIGKAGTVTAVVKGSATNRYFNFYVKGVSTGNKAQTNAVQEISQVINSSEVGSVFLGTNAGKMELYSITFTPATMYQLTVTQPATGGTIKIGDNTAETQEYVSGTEVTLTAEPASGYRFGYWTVDGVRDTDNTTNTLTLTMSAVHSVTATFEANSHVHNFNYAVGTGENTNILTATCQDAGCSLTESKATLTLTAAGGTYNGSPFGASTDLEAFNSSTGLSATVSINYTGDNSYNSADAPTNAGNYTATATVTIGETNYTLNKSFTIAKASITELTITGLDAPVGGMALDTEVACSSTGIESVSVVWKNGETDATGNAEASTVYTAIVTLTASSNYVFAESPAVNAISDQAGAVTRNGDTQISVAYTFDATEADDPVTHVLTVNVDDASHGSVAITVNGSAANSGDAVAEGASVSVTATANSGYTFKNWGNTEQNSNPYEFTMGTSDVTLTATFEEDSPAAEEYVGSATTWTFNSQTPGEITNRTIINKLYARVVSGRSYTFEALETAQSLTFSDGASTTVSVEKVAKGTGTISYGTKIKTANDSPSGSSNDMTPSFAFNTTVKGTVYAYLQEAGGSHNSSYRQRIYFGTGESAISSVYSQEGAKARGVEEIKYTSSSAGTFVVGSTTALSKIYAIRFVPTRTITISDAIEHGTITADKSEGGMGDVVTLTITPSTGYELGSVSVNGNAIEGTTFTMPDADVTVTATFTESAKTDISGAEVTLSNNSFICDGSEKAPTVTAVTLNSTGLVLNTDYTVNEITSKTNVGTYTVTVTGTGAYTGTATAEWTIKRNLGESVTLNGTQQWSTYYAAEDLAKPEGVTVYRVTGNSETAVQTEEVNYIKANTGVLLYSESDVDAGNLIVGPGSGDDYTSKLLGTVEAMGNGTNYVLYNNQFILAEDKTLPANRCYLQIPGVSGTRSLTIEHGDDNTTGIHTTLKDHGDMINDIYYTLSGQRVEKPTKKGLYIMNGRKVVVK